MKTMKRGLIALATALALPAAAAHAQGTTTEVGVDAFDFVPKSIESDVGVASIHWGWATTIEHNVRERSEIFRSGAPTTDGDYTINPSAGTFKYYCEPHGLINSSGKPVGMAGEIAVAPTATPQGKRTLVTWATEATDTGNRYDVRMKKGKKKPKVVEENTKAIEGAFKVENGTKYRFDVRSRQGKRASDWSPPVTVKG
jgi:plastocyanin